MLPPGVEPGLRVPQTRVLSIKLWEQSLVFKTKILDYHKTIKSPIVLRFCLKLILRIQFQELMELKLLELIRDQYYLKG